MLEMKFSDDIKQRWSSLIAVFPPLDDGFKFYDKRKQVRLAMDFTKEFSSAYAKRCVTDWLPIGGDGYRDIAINPTVHVGQLRQKSSRR